MKALTLLNPHLPNSSIMTRGNGGEKDRCMEDGEAIDEQERVMLFPSGCEIENKEPLLMLLVGVTLLNIASMRAIKAQAFGRNRTVLAAFAFLEGYASERLRRTMQEWMSSEEGEEGDSGGGECKAEVSYNLGRGAHQMGQVRLAQSHYLDVLEGEGSGEGVKACRFEAAHNLAMIYSASGAKDAAREVYQRYLVID